MKPLDIRVYIPIADCVSNTRGKYILEEIIILFFG